MTRKIYIVVTLEEDQELHDAMSAFCNKHNLNGFQRDMTHDALFLGAIMSEIRYGRADIKEV